MKPQGFKQQEVASNLDYLIQKGWVREVIENRTFTTQAGTTQQAEKRSYKISDAGIDRLEAASTYQRSPTAPHLNITNIQGVTVVGDGNVVNTTFTELFRVLEDMKKAVLVSPAIEDQEKLDVVADIDSLQSQLQKPFPSGSVVRTLWAGIEKAVTAAGFVELVAKAATVIAPLLRTSVGTLRC
ncbi:MAG: hypothetical protein QME92_08890 [Bacillota bacterium]|nr:hypothetical protein [Bacillota bacterium]